MRQTKKGNSEKGGRERESNGEGAIREEGENGKKRKRECVI